MKKTAILILVFSLFLCLCACTASNEGASGPTTEAFSSAPSAEPTAAPTEAITEAPAEEPTYSEAPTASPDSYLGALSEADKESILSFASDWYAEHLSGAEILSMEFFEDDDTGYSFYPQYAPGEIVILKVVTSLEGLGSGCYRTCFITISPDGYSVINEGY